MSSACSTEDSSFYISDRYCKPTVIVGVDTGSSSSSWSSSYISYIVNINNNFSYHIPHLGSVCDNFLINLYASELRN